MKVAYILVLIASFIISGQAMAQDIEALAIESSSFTTTPPKKPKKLTADEQKQHDKAMSIQMLALPSGSTLNNGLSGYYPFDGNANDYSGYSRHASAYNVTTTTGIDGSAYNFNGSSSYIQLPYTFSTYMGSNQFTLCAWANITAVKSIYYVFWACDDQPSFLFYNNSYWPCFKGNLNANPPPYGQSGVYSGEIPTNQWLHLVIKLEGRVFKTYLNGVYKGQVTLGANFIPGSTIYVGRDNMGSARYLNGKVDELRIYNRTLTDAEIQELYNSSTLLAPTSLTTSLNASNNVVLNWMDRSTNETGFTIERKAVGGNYEFVYNTGANVTTYTDLTASANIQYTYRVKAYNSMGSSTYSNEPTLLTRPLPPTNLLAGAFSSNQINLTWSSSTSCGPRVVIERSLDGGTYQTVTSVTASNLNYPDQGLAPSTLYYYNVKSWNISGYSGYSSVSATTYAPPPGAPTNLQAAAIATDKINLTWTGSAGATGYTIERSLNGTTYGAVRTVDYTTTAYEDKTLTPNVTYYYRMNAFNSGGSSAYTNAVSTITYPIPPSNLAVLSVSPTRLDLNWTAGSGYGDRIVIERRTAAGIYSTVTSVVASNVSFMNESLEPNTQYFYQLKSYNNSGYSTYTSEAQGMTKPLPPSNITAPKLTSNRIDLAWTSDINCGERVIIERKLEGGTFQTVTSVTASNGAYTDESLTPNTQYYYQIKSCNIAGYSAYSTELAAKTLPLPPAAPGGFTAQTLSANKIGLSWTSSPGTDKYTIERGLSALAYIVIATVEATAISYEDRSLTANTAYYYRIKSSNTGGSSGYSLANAITLNLYGTPSLYWPMDNCEGSVVANEAGTVNGTLTGGRWSSGFINQGLLFNGSTDEVTAPLATPKGGNMSLTFYARITRSTQDEFTGVFSSANDITNNGSFQVDIGGASKGYPGHYRLLVYNNSQPQVLDIGPVDNYGAVTAFIAVTCENGTWKTYYQGQPVASQTGLVPAYFNNYQLARNLNGAGVLNSRFDGMIDEVRIYDYPLSAESIEKISATPENSAGCDNDANLISHWPLEESSGEIASDKINLKNGNRNGTPRPGNTLGKINYAILLDNNIINNYKQYLELPVDAAIDRAFTLSFFVRIDEIPVDNKVVFTSSSDMSVPGSMKIWVKNGKYEFYYNDGTSIHKSSVIISSSWQELTLVSDGNTIKFYSNYQSVDQFTLLNQPKLDFLRFGTETPLSGFFIGSFDEVRLYKGCVSDDEIASWESYEGTIDQNYIYTYTPRVELKTENEVLSADKNDVSLDIDYFDGLGRPMQKISRNGSPDGNDIIQPIEYDVFGREAKNYLPYSKNNDGNYRADAANEVYQFYTTQEGLKIPFNPYPYAIKEFDNSPLNRVLKQGAPGHDWQPNTHPVQFEYSSNIAGDVALWTVDISDNANKSGTYNANELYLSVVKDELWTSGKLHTTEEYKDKEGKVILKRTYVEGDPDPIPVETYYIYDDFGLLRYVLPPEASKSIKDNGTTLLNSGSDIILKYGYYYQYDAKHRMTIKQIPGAWPIYLVYDKLDRLRLSQDGNQRTDSDHDNKNEWTYTKYDEFSRPIETGIYTHNTILDQSDMQTEIDNAPVTLNGAGSFPVSSCNVLTSTYYDDYSFTRPDGIPNFTGASASDALLVSQVKGKVTGTKTKVLSATGIDLVSALFYDKFGRVKKTYSQNHLGGIDEVSNSFKFSGEITETYTTHRVPSNGKDINVMKSFEYDHRGRLLKTRCSSTGLDLSDVILSAVDYNETGQLVKKQLGSQDGGKYCAQTLDYQYNERGWLTDINDFENLVNTDLFGIKFNYNFNGNISRTLWKHKGYLRNQYSYTYDALNRLKDANFSGYYTDDNDLYSERGIEYDLNGNINRLIRRGHAATSTSLQINLDNLEYEYIGNQVRRIIALFGEGYEPDQNIEGYPDFYKRPENADAFENGEYRYDNNGNMYFDYNKGIQNIEFTPQNLPKKITFTGTNRNIEYVYTATGAKLQQVVKDGTSTTTTDYVGSFVYKTENGASAPGLEYVITEEGRIVKSLTGIYEYQYDLKDHLGNTRVTFKGNYDSGGKPINIEVLGKHDYYAFGMEAGENASAPIDNANKYLYNGKEFITDLNLRLYDYNARFYDPQRGQWTTIDPMNEMFFLMSPYSYALNNPIKYIDRNGKTVFIYYMSADFSLYGILGHNAIAVQPTPHSEILYHPASGNVAVEKEMKGIEDYSPYKGYDESETVKGYVQSGDIVYRMQIDLPLKVEQALALIIEGNIRNGQAPGCFCTSQTKAMLYQAFIYAGYSKEEADEKTGKIIPYFLPENMSEEDMKNAGFKGYDKFSKDKDGKVKKDSKEFKKFKWTNADENKDKSKNRPDNRKSDELFDEKFLDWYYK